MTKPEWYDSEVMGFLRLLADNLKFTAVTTYFLSNCSSTTTLEIVVVSVTGCGFSRLEDCVPVLSCSIISQDGGDAWL